MPRLARRSPSPGLPGSGSATSSMSMTPRATISPTTLCTSSTRWVSHRMACGPHSCVESKRRFTVRCAPAYDEALGTAWGRTYYAERSVAVKSTADPAGACKTLAHELAHVLLHEHRLYGHRGTVEVEAESVAFIVSAAWGLDTSSYSTGYLAGWSGGDVAAITATADKVLGCARAILEAAQPDEEVVPA